MADEDPVATLGEVIRRQRELNRLSMRQFAQMAGISNPYLSQIERGLRAPSQRVVDAIARSLETSADALYEQAGVNPEDEPEAAPGVRAAMGAARPLPPRRRRALLDVSAAFVGVGEGRRGAWGGGIAGRGRGGGARSRPSARERGATPA